MKIEKGKFYRTRDGRKVGPMTGDEFKWVEGFDDTGDKEWYNNGANRAFGMTSADDLVEEWTDESEKLKAWGEMTDAEKGALLLAQYEGKEIECFQKTLNVWAAVNYPVFNSEIAYRVKPEPKRKTVVLNGRRYPNGQWVFGEGIKQVTHRIVFEVFDGEPDCNSNRMEKLREISFL